MKPSEFCHTPAQSAVFSNNPFTSFAAVSGSVSAVKDCALEDCALEDCALKDVALKDVAQ